MCVHFFENHFETDAFEMIGSRIQWLCSSRFFFQIICHLAFNIVPYPISKMDWSLSNDNGLCVCVCVFSRSIFGMLSMVDTNTITRTEINVSIESFMFHQIDNWIILNKQSSTTKTKQRKVNIDRKRGRQALDKYTQRAHSKRLSEKF